MSDENKVISVNGRDYAWPKQAVVVVCIDGSEPAYIEQAIADGTSNLHRSDVVTSLSDDD